MSHSSFRYALSSFSPGSKAILTLSSYYGPKKNSQLKVFFVYCYLVARKTGHSKTDIQNTFLNDYGLYESFLNKHGDQVFRPRPLSSYDSREMSELLDRINGSLYDDFNTVLPDLNEVNNF